MDQTGTLFTDKASYITPKRLEGFTTLTSYGSKDGDIAGNTADNPFADMNVTDEAETSIPSVPIIYATAPAAKFVPLIVTVLEVLSFNCPLTLETLGVS